MDELAVELDEPVIIQSGHSTYIPRHAEHFQFTDGVHMEQLNQEARIVVGHAAAGTVIVALRHRKPLIVVPRLQRLGESVDNHQLQLAAALAATSKVVTVYEPSAITLRTALNQATHQKVIQSGPTQLVQAIQQQLRQWRPAGSEAWLKEV